MMKSIMVIVLFCFLYSVEAKGQSVLEIDKDGIELLTKKCNDTTYVVNFWATWCSPCVKEIGYFEELHREYGDGKMKVILVSLDFPNQVEERLIPFLVEKDISASVVIMTDMDYNGWIDRVEASWTGAIPATLIYNSEGRLFLEEELTREALFEYVNLIMN